MSARDAVGATREAVAALTAAVDRLRDEYGDTLGIRRITSDVTRFSADLDEIPDEPYDESMWGPDAESESTHAQ